MPLLISPKGRNCSLSAFSLLWRRRAGDEIESWGEVVNSKQFTYYKL